MAGSNRDDEARERARRRLEERQARMRGEVPADRDARETHESISSGRLRSSRPGTGNRHAWDAHGSEAVFALSETAMNLVRAIGFKRLAIGIAALVLVVALVMSVRGCMSAGAASPEPEAPVPVENAPDAVQPEPQDPIDEATLASLLGDDVAASLVQAASTNADAAWIAAHPEAYAMDGEDVQRKLLKLAAVEPEAVPFVRGVPDAYPADAGQACDVPAAGKVPRLYQWDPRWGSTVYSSTAFALTGCCPTSLSMVYQGLTGKGDLSPYDMGQRAREGGYETEFDGTDASFLVYEADSLGLSCEELGVDADALRETLSAGHVVICNVGPGDFTEAGHFFVITGLNDDGTLAINDPYSAERSNRAWDIDKVLAQTMALYAYFRA